MRNFAALARGEYDICDAALLQATQDNPHAFAALYERYHDRVYAYLRTRTSTVEDAADLTQQVFLRALDALPRYRGTGERFPAWLFHIARNAATDHYRRRHAAVPWDLLPESLQPTTDDVERRAMQNQDAAQLRSLLAALDEDTRELLALRFGAEITIGEIATIVGKGEAATRKRLARTLRTLAARVR